MWYYIRKKKKKKRIKTETVLVGTISYWNLYCLDSYNCRFMWNEDVIEKGIIMVRVYEGGETRNSRDGCFFAAFSWCVGKLAFSIWEDRFVALITSIVLSLYVCFSSQPRALLLTYNDTWDLCLIHFNLFSLKKICKMEFVHGSLCVKHGT